MFLGNHKHQSAFRYGEAIKFDIEIDIGSHRQISSRHKLSGSLKWVKPLNHQSVVKEITSNTIIQIAV